MCLIASGCRKKVGKSFELRSVHSNYFEITVKVVTNQKSEQESAVMLYRLKQVVNYPL
jgi:hypothetical protein